MGWTFFRKPPGRSAAQIVSDELFPYSYRFEKGIEIEAASCVKGAVYMAVSTPATEWYNQLYQPDADGRVTFAMVVLVKNSMRNGVAEFGYKDMTETMGPVEDHCPMWILEKLPPFAMIENETRNSISYGAAWRSRCEVRTMEAKAARAGSIRLVSGMHVMLPEPITFTSGVRLGTFYVAEIMQRGRKMTVFRGEDGHLYRLPKATQLKLRPFAAKPDAAQLPSGAVKRMLL